MIGTLQQAPNASALVEPTKLPYCGEGNYTIDGHAFAQYPCVYYDEFRVAFPGANSLLAASRITNEVRRMQRKTVLETV